MTEGDAHKRWCPFARVIAANPTGDAHRFDLKLNTPAFNRIDALMGRDNPVLSQASYCLGSACMAWRWKVTRQPARIPQALIGEGAVPISAAPYENVTSTTDGFCGLAGQEGQS